MAAARASAKIAERIRELRHRTTVSQQKLADHASLAKKTVERIEAGTENPSLFVLIQLATALGVSVSDLVDGFTADDLPADKRPHPVANAAHQASRRRAAG